MDVGLYRVAIRQYLRNMRKAILTKKKKDADRTFMWRSVCHDLDPYFSMMDATFNSMMEVACD